MADEESTRGAHEGFNNLIAITIALLASFIAVATIKAGNVEQAMTQAQAQINDNWAWYQAVRVREDMATYELAHLKRLAAAQPKAVAAPTMEAVALAGEIKAQEAEVVRIRARLSETQGYARTAEKQHEALSVFDDQYDFSQALISIAVTLLAVSALAKARWLYGFALLPAAGGLFWGGAAMARWPIHSEILFAWLQ